MKLVIQCAGSKQPEAGSLRTGDGRQVHFVAHPEAQEEDEAGYYARPDDPSDDGRTWRERVLAYNAAPGDNKLHLLPAAQLYKPREYQRLEQAMGPARLFILSAGWGLIPASFLTPDYNITFSGSAPRVFRRRRSDVFHDWAMVDMEETDPLVFLGGKDYLPQFSKLTQSYAGPRLALFNSRTEPSVEGVKLLRYETNRRTNWHYEAADALIEGALELPGV